MEAKECKIFIDDPVSRMGGGSEVEIDKNNSIRFEVDGDKFIVSIKEGRLHIYKQSSKMDGSINVRPHSSNVISVS